MNVGDAPVPQPDQVLHQRSDALGIVGQHGGPVVEHMVNGHTGQIALHQLHHLGVAELHAGGHHAVHPTVPAVLQIAGGLAADVMVDEGDVVPAALRFFFKGVQHGGEILMGQAALGLVHKEHPNVVGAVGLEGAGHRVGHIAQPLGGFGHPLAGGLADIAVAVQRLADGCHRYATFCGDDLDGNHRRSPCLPINRFRKSNIQHLAAKCKAFLKKSVGNDGFGGLHSLNHENLYENHEEFASKSENDFRPNSRRAPREKRGRPAPKKGGQKL